MWNVESQIFVAQEGVKTSKYCLKILKKMSRDTFENTPLPHVSFGDIVSTPPPKCHVLFEWPLNDKLPHLLICSPEGLQ